MADNLDFKTPRLFVDVDLDAGTRVPLTREQANYLLNVLRCGSDEPIRVFNGRDGEWMSVLAIISKRETKLDVTRQLRPQSGGPDVHYLFALLKRSRLDYMVQKATELGVAHLAPIITRRTNAERVNLDRMRANVIEAAEQCGVLRVPSIAAPQALGKLLTDWDATRRLIFCDEGAEIADPIAALRAMGEGPVALLIGPEGGFDPAEREMLMARPFVTRLSLGPRIMRADTAAVAALSLINATLGDWR